ncbi:DUF3775 domain-containing protein [Rubellimicrobium rubrum]|uniref:DUF3775 domain-containing protein n=1 Tax=Rubellimicrobium rubrum TaxID=2585369 RepID=A0A5C4MSI0_9RHOB|nr:DUF3775 domain-containing protein [Rubellimicrobium rubrum]TNC48789.1 DUF3775 domain-containing protein [Rubellimicrobium rubrum]
MDIGADQVGEVILLAREMVEQYTGANEQFDGLIEGMNDDQRLDLVALCWIGRGDFEPEEWDEARRTASEEATLSVAEYLKGVDHLAEHLEAGLDAMGINPVDAEDSATES